MVRKFVLLLLILFNCSLHSIPTPEQKEVVNEFIQNRAIFFIGYPGSGKGTQGKIIASELGIQHLSTGELFRAEAQKGTAIGLQMNEYMKRGEIIPKELTFEFLKNELSDPKYRSGFILDGYPKNLECCNFILKTLQELGFKPSIAMHFDLSRDEVISRLTGRLHCNTCEKDFHKTYLPPKNEMICDACGGALESRFDDSEAAIHKRLNIFEQNTGSVIYTFAEMGILYVVDALKNITNITDDIYEILIKKSVTPNVRDHSYYLRVPLPGEEKKSIFHNHIDACSQDLLCELVTQIENDSPSFQNKIYPISHLFLGPQTTDAEFDDVYSQLPNFHSIENATHEAFATGKMGAYSFDYDQIRRTLEIVSQYPNQGVMTELEEEIYDRNFNNQGEEIIVVDRGYTSDIIDWNELEGWQELLIDNIPAFELHHGFDIAKMPGETTPPIELERLMDLTSKNGFQLGGWFIFSKRTVWSYRCNQFSNDSYENVLETLNKQALHLRSIVQTLCEDRPFSSSCSLEKVHAIWKF